MSTPTPSPRRSWEDPRLPAHARILANDELWLETDAIDQLIRAASDDDCCDAVGMPDIHPGPASPIGAVLSYQNTIVPPLIGGDAGCGARLMAVQSRRFNPDRVEARLRKDHALDWIAELDPEQLLEAVWRRGILGLCDLAGVPENVQALAAHDETARATACDDSYKLPEWCEAYFAAQLGTVGAGNHFLEITRIQDVRDAEHATDLGLAHQQLGVLAHTGSRALGKSFADRWRARRLTEVDSQNEFLRELAGTLRYAACNRFLCAFRGLAALGVTRPDKISCGIDLCHNDVRREGERWVHRKGAAPAHQGQPALILGSRGSLSWVVMGHGSPHSAASVAHGAGRRMTRSEARAKIKHKYKRKQLQRTALGSRVVCDQAELLLEEHPDAYKAIEPVLASLESAGAATRVAAMAPQITVKL